MTDTTDHVAAAKARGTADRLAGRERNCFAPAMERVPAAKRLAAIMAYGEGFSGEERQPIDWDVIAPPRPLFGAN